MRFALRIICPVLVTVVISACAAPVLAETLTVATWANDAEYQMVQTLALEYQKVEPGVSFDVLRKPQDQFAEWLTTLFVGNVSVDVAWVPQYSAHQMMDQQMLQDLRPWVERDRLNKADWPAGIWEITQHKGKQLGLPAQVVTYALGYNESILRESGLNFPSATEPLNWQELEQVAKRLTRDTDGDGVTDQWGYGARVDVEGLIPYVLQNGGRFLNEDGTRVLTDSYEALEATNWLHNLVASGVTPNRTPNPLTERVGLWQFGSWSIMGLETGARTTGFSFGVSPTIVGKQRADVGYVFQWGMVSNSRNKEGSWEFLKWVTGPKGQQVLPTVRRIPTHRQAFQYVRTDDAVLWGFIQNLAYVQAWPLHREMQSILRIFNNELTKVWNGQASPATALELATKQANALPGFSR